MNTVARRAQLDDDPADSRLLDFLRVSADSFLHPERSGTGAELDTTSLWMEHFDPVILDVHSLYLRIEIPSGS